MQTVGLISDAHKYAHEGDYQLLFPILLIEN